MLTSTRSFIIIFFLTYLFGCRREVESPETPAISFSGDIQPVIIGNCTSAGCHGDVSTDEFPLLTYDDVLNSGVSPGDAHNSKFYDVITGRGEEMMPPGDGNQLSDRQLVTVYLWIMQGAKNN